MTQKTIEKFEKFKVIELYIDGDYSLNQLQSLVQSDKRTIRDYLLANDINVLGINDTTNIPNKNILGLSKSDKRFNYSKFNIIDTEEKAYWLGFIFADGYVGNEDFRFELGLQAKDVGHLHKFNRFIECSDNNVKYHPKITETKIYDGYRWCISNEKLWMDLNSYGCVPKKSLILEFPSEDMFQDKSLIRHFIRGYWDGDGCITITNKTKITSALGTKKFLNEMKKYLPMLIDKNIYQQKSKNNSTFVLQISDKEAYKTLKFLYQNATIFLDRKYNKYLEICRLYEESYR